MAYPPEIQAEPGALLDDRSRVSLAVAELAHDARGQDPPHPSTQDEQLAAIAGVPFTAVCNVASTGRHEPLHKVGHVLLKELPDLTGVADDLRQSSLLSLLAATELLLREGL